MHRMLLSVNESAFSIPSASRPHNQAHDNNVYIIHRFDASSTRHWFPWPNEFLTDKGAITESIDMPTPAQPDCKTWISFLSEHLTCITSNTYFVTHSLGCITTLRYLQTVAAPIGGAMLVSGFGQSIPDFSFLEGFTATIPNYKLLSRTIPNRAVVSAIDDPIVPHEFSRSFAERFDAVFYETKTGRHYLDADGVTTLPIAADVLSRMME